jgi:hypothetical protein
VRLDDLEAMLGVGSGGPAAEPRPRAAKRAAAVEIDLPGLGLMAHQPQAKPAPSAAGQPVSPEVATAPPWEPPRVEPPPQRPSEPPPSPAETADHDEVELHEEPLELLEVPGVFGGPSEDQLRELDFYLQQGLLDDAAKLLSKLREAFGDHADVTARHALLKARGWDEDRPPRTAASAADLFNEEEQFFDLAAELEKELADDELVAEATGAGKGDDVSIEELFKEFQRGVAEQVHEEDYDTHFNLGLAYREMGLLDEAIGEFQLSTKSPEYLVESASMIGSCYLDKGLPEQAAEWYARALAAPGVAPEVHVGLRYELGRAHELAGNITGALAAYAEVLAINPSYRDVVDRVSRLRTN